jgi:hypothetical protein
MQRIAVVDGRLGPNPLKTLEAKYKLDTSRLRLIGET